MLIIHAFRTPIIPAKLVPAKAGSGNPQCAEMTKQPAVYILASRRNGTLYTGVTSDLLKRIWEHRSGLVGGFTKRYGVHRLIYFEIHDYMTEAIRREKQIKKWRRAWKIDLIERTNPQWHDLWPTIVGDVDSRLRGNDDKEDENNAGQGDR
jgi:putative endonuclease